MDTTSWHERQTERLKKLSIINPKINPDNHKRDFILCQDFLCRKECKEFEVLLRTTLKNIEQYLKYNRKRLNINDDYPDIFGGVSEKNYKKVTYIQGRKFVFNIDTRISVV